MTVEQTTIDEFGLLPTFDGTEIFYVIKSDGNQFQDHRITGSLLVDAVIASLPSSLVTLADDQTITGLKRFERTIEVGVTGQGILLDAPDNQNIKLDFAQNGAVDYSFVLNASEEFQFLDSSSNVVFQHTASGLNFPNGFTAGGSVVVPAPTAPEEAARLSEVSAIEAYADSILAAANAHAAQQDNPHNVTATQVGTLATAAINALVNAVQQALDTHEADQTNPHSVTAEQVGNDTAQWNAYQLLGVPLLQSTPQDAEVWAYNSVTQRYELGPKSATPIGTTLESIKNLTTTGLISRQPDGLVESIDINLFIKNLLLLQDLSALHNYLKVGDAQEPVTVYYSNTATGPGAIPFDDTIPTSSEGNEFMTASITPTDASNYLIVEVGAWLSERSNTGSRISGAIFRDSDTQPIDGGCAAITSDDDTAFTAGLLIINSEKILAGNTNPTTFRFRGGLNGGPVGFNELTGSRRFGGKMSSFIRVREVHS
ncbi:MAG: hypothetical protein AAFY20_18430 [Cyanobacteria bacterium J06639_14]